MKKLLTLALLLVPTLMSAQDIIATQAADEIEAKKVLEVNVPDLRPTGQRGKVQTRLSVLPEELLGSPWAGKFTLGARVEFGGESLYAWAKGSSVTASSKGYYFGGTAYGEYHTKSKEGWLFGAGVGYRQSVYNEKAEGIKTRTNLGSVVADFYAGGAGRYYRFDDATQSYVPRKASLVSRFGLRLRMPVLAETRGSDMGTGIYLGTHDFVKQLNPVQAGLFADMAVHFKGFGIGFDVGFLFTNFYNKKKYYPGITSMIYSAGIYFEYTF